MIGKIIDTYWQSTIINGKSFLLNNSKTKIKKATFCINIFYFLVFYLSIKIFSPYSQFPKWDVLISSKRLFTPVWSSFWIEYFDWEITVKMILFSFFTCSFLAIIFWRRSRVIRVILFLSMFLYLSLIFSFSNRESWMYLMTISAFLLIFIPNSRNEDSNEIGLLYVFFGIQTLLLNIYFVSGFFKFYGLLRQEFNGAISAFSSIGFSEYSAMNSYHHNEEYFFTSFVLENSSFLFSIFLILGFCVEFFSIYIIFKPKYHRIWGLMLILLHSFILMFIGPDFTVQVLTVGIFIFFSPFVGTYDVFEDIKELPKTFKSFFSKPISGDSTIIFYDDECLTCNRFLIYISKYAIPNSVRICSQNSNIFQSLVSHYNDISSIGSIVILEYDKSDGISPKILLKANAISWLLAKFKFRYKILRVLYLIFPFIGNLFYDLIAHFRKKTINEECLLPPSNLSHHLINDTVILPENIYSKA